MLAAPKGSPSLMTPPLGGPLGLIDPAVDGVPEEATAEELDGAVLELPHAASSADAEPAMPSTAAVDST